MFNKIKTKKNVACSEKPLQDFFDSRAPTALQSGNIIKFLSGWERKCHAFESNLVIYSFAIENFNDYFKDKDF